MQHMRLRLEMHHWLGRETSLSLLGIYTGWRLSAFTLGFTASRTSLNIYGCLLVTYFLCLSVEFLGDKGK